MYAHVEPYQRPYHPLIFYLFFPLFKLLFSLFYKNKLYKKKNSSSPYWSTFIITIPLTFPFPLYLLSPHYSLLTITLPSLFSLSYILNILLPHFILYKFDIISLIQSISFIQKNCKFSLSLSLSLGWIFVLSYYSD